MIVVRREERGDAATGRRSSLADVAKRSGVSISTASKAINGRFDVSEVTRARVLDAAAALDFTPNALARGLLEGRSHTVGIVTNDTTGRFVSSIMLGAQRALERSNETDVGVLLVDSGGNPRTEERHIRFLLERRVDGLVLVDDVMRPRSPALYVGGVPTVYAFAASTDPDDTSVIADLRQGGRVAAEHLLDIGRESLVHLGGPAAWPSARERAAGMRDALIAAGLPVDPFRVAFGDWSETWGWDGVESLISSGRHVDGIVAGNDQIARGAIDCLMRHGTRVPDDVAVVGYDNWEVLSRWGRLPNSSIDMRLEEIGARAVAELYGVSSPARGVIRVPGALVVRESTVRGAGGGPNTRIVQ